VSEGRKFAWWAELMFLVMAFVWFLIAIIDLTLYAVDGGAGRLAIGIFGLFAMVICFLSSIFLKKTVLDAIDQGRFHDAKNDSVIWIIIGFFGFAIPTIFLILTYVKIGDALMAQTPAGYQPYAPGTVVAQAPAPMYAPPPVPPAQPAATAGQHPQQYHAHQTPMHKCKNCNVQYPMFMHSCPNCGAPKE
jgi:membrane protease YdiL (CAAX protease family)